MSRIRWNNSIRNAVLSALLALGVGGCATQGDNPTGGPDSSMVDSESAFGYREPNWGQPFWERWLDEARAAGQAQAANDTGNNTTNEQLDPEATPAIAESAQIESSSAQSSSAAAPSTGAAASSNTTNNGGEAGMRSSLAVLVDAEDRNSAAAYQFANAIKRRAQARGFTVVAPETVYDAVENNPECRELSAAGCLQSLAVYPGIRLLVSASVESGRGETVPLTTRMIDTDFGLEYRADAIDWPASGSAAAGSDATVALERVVDAAETRIEVAPWFTHAFRRSGDRFYLSAGQSSGLSVGDRLEVHADGELIRVGDGQPAVWRPGPSSGVLEVTDFLGDRIAIAESVSGAAPAPQDKLTIER